MIIPFTTFSPCQIKICFQVHADISDQGQPALLHSLILAFADHLQNMSILKTLLFKYIENFTTKNGKFSDKNADIPTIYVLSRSKENNVYSCKPQFYYIKVEFIGVRIIKVYFHDVFLKRTCCAE